jgi:hypothetical protein
MRMRIGLVFCAALALTVGAATATAGGGNSANAKACQKGGWQSLHPSGSGASVAPSRSTRAPASSSFPRARCCGRATESPSPTAATTPAPGWPTARATEARPSSSTRLALYGTRPAPRPRPRHRLSGGCRSAAPTTSPEPAWLEVRNVLEGAVWRRLERNRCAELPLRALRAENHRVLVRGSSGPIARIRRGEGICGHSRGDWMSVSRACVRARDPPRGKPGEHAEFTPRTKPKN